MERTVPDDEGLIAAIAAADDGALRELYARHAPWLAVRLRRALSPATVEDVLQETFIAIWRAAPGYRPAGTPGAWLWGIARRQAALWARKHGRPVPGFAVGQAEDPALTAARRVDLERAFRTLGPRGAPQRELAQLVFVEDRPVADVAARLGIPPGTVKSRVFALRRALRAALGGGALGGEDDERTSR